MNEGQGLAFLVPTVVEGERGATEMASFLLDRGFIMGMSCSVQRFFLLFLGRKTNKKKP